MGTTKMSLAAIFLPAVCPSWWHWHERAQCIKLHSYL